MFPSRILARAAVSFVLFLRANAQETHTFTYLNKCGYGTPKQIYNGVDLLNGASSYTSNSYWSGIAYLQTGYCNTNGENCTLLETTLINPTCSGCGGSTDISLIAPHAYSVETSFAYYNGCDGQGKDCNNANCVGDAFFGPTDYVAQVACQTDNVNLLIVFCANATDLMVNQGLDPATLISSPPTTSSLPTNSLPTSSPPTLSNTVSTPSSIPSLVSSTPVSVPPVTLPTSTPSTIPTSTPTNASDLGCGATGPSTPSSTPTETPTNVSDLGCGSTGPSTPSSTPISSNPAVSASISTQIPTDVPSVPAACPPTSTPTSTASPTDISSNPVASAPTTTPTIPSDSAASAPISTPTDTPTSTPASVPVLLANPTSLAASVSASPATQQCRPATTNAASSGSPASSAVVPTTTPATSAGATTSTPAAQRRHHRRGNRIRY